ncbi:MAG: aspartyl protease family protein [Flavisolibacter sp.]
MRKAILVLTALLLIMRTVAQEEFVVPSEKICRFSFIQLTGGVILLQGRLDPFPDTLNFILDTGSGGISLDSTTVEYFGLKPEPSNRTIRGIGGIKPVSFLYNRTLHLEGITIDSLNFHVNNYDILTAVYGEKIDGIIGYAVFSRFIIKLDYDESKIEFWTQGNIKYPRGGHMLRPSIGSTLPVTNGRIRDNRIISSRFLFDIGAGLNLMLSTEFVNDSSFLKKNKKMFEKEAEGLGGKIDLHVTVIREVKVGPYRFRNVPVEIFDDTYNVTSYPTLGGLIGNDLLRRFNVTFNYRRREFHLVPNKHYGDPFDYSYSGVTLYYINGSIIVGNISKGSPAEQAGLKEGDVVLAINNNFNQSMTVYKSALQVAGQNIKMIVLREGQLLEFRFKVKSIR